MFTYTAVSRLTVTLFFCLKRVVRAACVRKVDAAAAHLRAGNEWSFVIHVCYYNSDNDIAWGETGVPASSRGWRRRRSARFETSGRALPRRLISAPIPRLFLPALIILLFERKPRKRQVRATAGTLMLTNVSRI